jgi:hypothetical protein
MAVHFYCDESEDKESKVLSLAGFLGKAEDWETLQEEWITRVKPTGVSAYHMTDCDNGQGEFSDSKGWTKRGRTQLTTDLIEIITKYNVYLLGLSVLLDDYESIPQFPGTNECLGRDKWHLLFQGIFMYAVKLLGPAPQSENIACFFDWKEKKGVAYSIFDDIKSNPNLGEWTKRLGTLAFGHKEFDVVDSIPLLQVADIAAIETRKALANPITHPNLSERKSLTRLKQTGRVWMLHLDNIVLDAMYEQKKKQCGLPNKADETFRKMRLRTINEFSRKGRTDDLLNYLLKKGKF